MVRAGATSTLRSQFEVCQPWMSSSVVVAWFLLSLNFFGDRDWHAAKLRLTRVDFPLGFIALVRVHRTSLL